MFYTIAWLVFDWIWISAEGQEFNPWLWNQYLSSSDILAQQLFTPPFKSHPLSIFPSLLLPLCLCVSVPVAGQCWCVWMCVRWLTFVLLEAENHGACGFSARHDVLGFVLFDTVSNPASPLVRLQEWCEHSGSSFSLCFLCVATEHSPSCPSPTDWLSDFQLSLCYAVLAECLLFFLSLMSDCLMLFACYSFTSGIPLPPFAAALCNQEAVQQCLRVSVSLPLIALSAHLSSHPSIWSQPNYGDAICAKDCLSFLSSPTNPSFPSLTDSPLTGWSIHRCLMDTNNCWHSQKSCQPTIIKNNESEINNSCIVLETLWAF